MVKNLKFGFYSSNYASWDTERKAKEPQPSTKHGSLKKSRKTYRNLLFLTKNVFLAILMQFFLIVS